MATSHYLSCYLLFPSLLCLCISYLDSKITVNLCENCFYKYRSSQSMPTCNHNNKITAEWNDTDKRFETTTFCRPIPERLPEAVRYIAMCDPYRGTCRREKCTFAHGRQEQRTWNSILRNRIQGLRNCIISSLSLQFIKCQILT